MATTTVPSGPEQPTDPPAAPADGATPAPAEDTGIMAALMAAVEPARPVNTGGAQARPEGDDPTAKVDAADAGAVVDRSSPGVTSASYRAPEDLAGRGSDAAGARYKEGIIKTLIRAGATRWAKGGGTTNKRLDLKKARAGAHQVKETRTTTVTNSPGLPRRNNPGNPGGESQNSGGKSPSGSGARPAGNGSTGSGNSPKNHSGAGTRPGGGRGPSDTRRGNNNGGSGGGTENAGNTGPTPTGTKNARSTGNDEATRGIAPRVEKEPRSKAGKNGKPAAPGNTGGSTPASAPKSSGSGGQPPTHPTGDLGAPDHPRQTVGNRTRRPAERPDQRTPLQRSRETGYGDGVAARNTIDHMKAYAKGAKDGYQDAKAGNSKEHARLDKAHAQHTTRRQTTPPNDGDHQVSTDARPLLVENIDANTLTLGPLSADSARPRISRKELRNFKQYEHKLQAKLTQLIAVAESSRSLQASAQWEAQSCQNLAEQAKSVEGGQKLLTKLTRLAEEAKVQATKATELRKRANRTADMCRVVLTNVATRYAPLYKAVVDSDETKPAELRFYSDKG